MLIPGLGLASYILQLLVCWKFRAETRSRTVRSVQCSALETELPLLVWLKPCALLTELCHSELHHYLICCSRKDLPRASSQSLDVPGGVHKEFSLVPGCMLIQLLIIQTSVLICLGRSLAVTVFWSAFLGHITSFAVHPCT